MRGLRVIVVVAGVVALAVMAIQPSSRTVAQGGDQATVAARQTAVAGLTGYGATIASWNAHHVADRRAAPGTAYDPLNDGNGTDRFAGVLTQDGRVVGFTIQFPKGSAGVSRREAEQQVRSVLPHDVTQVYDLTEPGCELLQYQSPTLRQAVGGSSDGRVNAEFWNFQTPDVYDPAHINTIDVTQGFPDDRQSIQC
jgi:hypothetical protein